MRPPRLREAALTGGGRAGFLTPTCLTPGNDRRKEKARPRWGEARDSSLLFLLSQEADGRAPIPGGDAKPRREPVRGDGSGGDCAGGDPGESWQSRRLLLPPVLCPVGVTGLPHTHTLTLSLPSEAALLCPICAPCPRILKRTHSLPLLFNIQTPVGLEPIIPTVKVPSWVDSCASCHRELVGNRKLTLHCSQSVRKASLLPESSQSHEGDTEVKGQRIQAWKIQCK